MRLNWTFALVVCRPDQRHKVTTAENQNDKKDIMQPRNERKKLKEWMLVVCAAYKCTYAVKGEADPAVSCVKIHRL